MVDTSVDFAGLKLRNPIVVGSSSLTNDFKKLKALQEAGAAAVITKLISDIAEPEHHKYCAKTGMFRHGLCVIGDRRIAMPSAVKMIKKAKDELTIPIIANFVGEGVDSASWGSNARQLEEAGADMLELDLHSPIGVANNMVRAIGSDPKATADMVEAAKKAVKIPVMIKLLPATDYLEVAIQSSAKGVDALSGINALPGILAPDIWNQGRPLYSTMKVGHIQGSYMGPGINPISLRFTITVARTVQKPLMSGGGVNTWENVVERLMFGASSVFVVSAIYLQGLDAIGKMKAGLEKFMAEKKMNSIRDIVGMSLQHYGRFDEAQVVTPEAELLDLDNSWPNHLGADWWASGN